MKTRQANKKSKPPVKDYKDIEVNEVFKPWVNSHGTLGDLFVKVRNKVTGNKIAVNLEQALIVNLPPDTKCRVMKEAYITYEE